MDKIGILTAAGLSCGADCTCVRRLANQLDDDQAFTIGHILHTKSHYARRALEEAGVPDMGQMALDGDISSLRSLLGMLGNIDDELLDDERPDDETSEEEHRATG